MAASFQAQETPLDQLALLLCLTCETSYHYENCFLSEKVKNLGIMGRKHFTNIIVLEGDD